MTHFVEGETAYEAWQKGASLLLSRRGELFNLVTRIEAPTRIDLSWLEDKSPNLFSKGADRIGDVSNTLFPEKLAAKVMGRGDLYRQYLARHDRAKKWKRGRGAWGTYFERLVRFPPTGVNQLERAIQKLAHWPRSTTGLVFHLSSPVVDAPRTRGGPCWQFGELVWTRGDVLDFVVVYRNHDFFNKTLGNFIGLGRLLSFICAHSGKRPGVIVCHSAHAYNGASAGALRRMLE